MNLMQFFLAGFETTFTALNYCIYVLSKHPEEMQKLQDEIDSYFADMVNKPVFEKYKFFKLINLFLKTEITYDDIQHLNYLDMFVSEVLRMYTVGDL